MKANFYKNLNVIRIYISDDTSLDEAAQMEYIEIQINPGADHLRFQLIDDGCIISETPITFERLKEIAKNG